MKPLHLSVLTTAAAAVFLMTGCKDDINSNQTSQAQKDEAPAAQQSGAADKQTASNTEATVNDAAITTKVKAAFFLDPTLKSLDITVGTSGGVVTLTGTTDTPLNQAHAAEIAQTVDGVKAVNNQLSVKNQS